MLLKNDKGVALLMVIIIMAFLLILGNSMLSTEIAEVYMNIHDEKEIQAYYIARSAAEALLSNLIENPNSIVGISADSVPEQTYCTTEFAYGTAEIYIVYEGDLPDGTMQFQINSKGIYKGVSADVVINLIKRRDDDNEYEIFENAISCLGVVDIKNLNLTDPKGELENSLVVDYSGTIYYYDDETGAKNVAVNPNGEYVWVQYDGSKYYGYKQIISYEDKANGTVESVLNNDKTSYTVGGTTFYNNGDNTYTDVEDNTYYYWLYDDAGVLTSETPTVTDYPQILMPPPSLPPYYDTDTNGDGSINSEDEPKYDYPPPSIPYIPDVDINGDGYKDDLIVSSNTTKEISESGYYGNVELNSNATLKINVAEDGILQIQAETFMISGIIEIIGGGTVHLIFDDWLEIGTNTAVNDVASKLLILYSEKAEYEDVEDDFIVSNGSAILYGFVYAPRAQSFIKAGATIYGALIVDALDGNGQANVIYDDAYEGLQTQFVISIGSYEIVPVEYK